MGSHDHREKSAGVGSVKCAVVTVSDSRTVETDESGKLIRELLDSAGHQVVAYDLLPNIEDRVSQKLLDLLSSDVSAIIFTGGTGLSRKDRTIEAATPYFEKTLPGFGELFRRLSEGEIGSAAMMSRAVAGVARGRLVVCLPGSKSAVALALNKLLVPELRHLVWEIGR